MYKIAVILLVLGLLSCENRDVPSYSEAVAEIFPDYTDVTIPTDIAPLNFSVCAKQRAFALLKTSHYSFEVSSDKSGAFTIPPSKWEKLLHQAKGDRIEITITIQSHRDSCIVYQPFYIYVANEPIDPYIAYRLIEPGYTLWNKMGIYQRDLSVYKETPVYENKMTGYNCVNCHSFCAQDPDKMLFHLRAKHAGTIVINDDEIDFLNTQTDQTLSSLVYPSWHPSGRFVAFSVNKTTQGFHPTQRVEVFDLASDVVVYDVEERTILSTPAIFSKSDFETFPTFSADGKTLYYCSGMACIMPDSIQNLKYSLCSISFDPETKSFGNRIDTLYNANRQGRSVSFPRVSPDGKYLLCTLSSYGTFPIWHPDADLYMIDLDKKEGFYPERVNSAYADSYHSWSSNSRWVVFSSRRLDGLYTRPFFAYVDENGEMGKPFLLPQKDVANYYTQQMKSYNIPEFVSGKIKNRNYQVMNKVKEKQQPVGFKMK